MKIFQQRTTVGYVLYAFIPLIIFMFASDHSTTPVLYRVAAISSFLAVVAYGFYQNIQAKKRIEAREQVLSDFATKNGLVFSSADPHNLQFFSSMSVASIDGARNPRCGNFMHSFEWDYCDYAYDYYHRTKAGDYKAGTVYYGVLAAALPRQMPHVFFDSKKARGRQFRFVYASDQIYHLEGDFSQSFTTYFGTDYKIDSLSFITPDVMQALLQASDYDIEIIDDHVYLYGPLTDTAEIQRMIQLVKIIKKEISENADSYRDERLPFVEGKQQVALSGRMLDRSRFWQRLTAGAVIAYVLFNIIGPSLISWIFGG